MPRRRNAQNPPTYRHHKASGQAAVVLDGKWHYLGPWQSEESKQKYAQRIAEWLATGRTATKIGTTLSIVELLDRYWSFAETYYVKDGRPTGELNWVRDALRPLKALYGHTAAADFGPLALKAVRQRIVETGISRRVVNRRVERIRRVFKWAVSNEFVPPAVYQAICTVEALRAGKCEARERPRVAPVADEVIDATLAKLPAVVADMVRFQRLTGCRPGEACMVRPCDVDRSGDVWIYRPESHKTEHHDIERTIFLGPRAQTVLAPYLLRAAEAYCFSPIESEADRNALRRDNRQTPMTPSQARRRPKRRPKRAKRERYDVGSYRRAINRAADLANTAAVKANGGMPWTRLLVPRWSPNQLRHAAATEIRRRFGLEAAQVVLGHSKADTTQIYAERDLAKAAAAMREVG